MRMLYFFLCITLTSVLSIAQEVAGGVAAAIVSLSKKKKR